MHNEEISKAGNLGLNTEADSVLELSSDTCSQLILGCSYCIDQCQQLLELISAEDYVFAAGDSSIGAHVRHVLDRFQCFFIGLNEDTINYDARKRDPEIENNLSAAEFSVSSVARRIQALGEADFQDKIVSVQETVHHQGSSVAISSTMERELMGLIAHSIHHLAIIALIAKAMGYSPGADFGKAPSAIVYELS